MTKIDIGELKMAREMLCEAQSLFVRFYDAKDARIRRESIGSQLACIQKMIDQIDVLRPLGPDGKHGNRHTPYCGCEDVPKPKGRVREHHEWPRDAKNGTPFDVWCIEHQRHEYFLYPERGANA